MSSRLLTADDGCRAEPVSWPTAPGVLPPFASATEPLASQETDTATLEREWTARVSAAHAQGLREGEASGRERAAAELQRMKDMLTRTLEELACLRPRLRREVEADTVKLALAIARRVIRRELTIDPEALHGLVLGALERLEAHEVTRLRVHASRVAEVAGLVQARAGCEGIEVVPHRSSDTGSMVFETTRGNLDASVDSQLGEIERGLADALRRSAG